MSDSVDLEKRVYALESGSKVLEAKFDAHMSETKSVISRDRALLFSAVSGGLLILVALLAATLLDRL